MKRLALATTIATTAAILLVGCGSSSSDDTTSDSATDVTVERGPVLKAVVVDAKGQMAKEVGEGKYEFLKAPTYPITAIGGFIDVNRDGIVGVGDINNTLTYHSATNGDAVTIVSAIAENNDTRNYLKTTYNLTDDEIDNALPQNNDAIAALSDAIFAYCTDNNISDPKTLSLEDIEALQSDVQSQLDEYKTTPDRTQVEEQLVARLGIPTLNTDEVLTLQTTGYKNNKDIVSVFPTYTLRDEDKEALAHMWNEEKLAHDVYIKLYELYPSLNTLYTIATNAESTHESMVQELIQKYDLNITSSDFNGTYNADELAKYGVGEFIMPSIQDLYNTLYKAGEPSQIDALKVGCMVEVTDINDLDDFINDGESTPDMLAVFDNLRNGSYHHYWAFDKALKSLGVEDGCCSAGDEYCKTTDDYPDDTGNGNMSGGNGYHGGR